MIVTGHEQEAQDFVAEKLLEVKHILDEIADETGLLYVVLHDDMAETIYKFGAFLGDTLHEWHKVVADRVILANNHREKELEWLKRNPDKTEGGEK